MVAIASYLPESQIITLGKNFPAMENPEELAGFVTPAQLGFFFHEWIHLLHNISTISGLTLFSVQVNLWSNFRSAMNEDGLSGGSENMPPEYTAGNANLLSYFISSRMKNTNKVPGSIKPSQIFFEVPELINMEVENDFIVKPSLIKCKVSCSGVQYDTEIGILEILESAAFMLEYDLVEKMNGTHYEAPFHPYHLVSGLASIIAPSLDNRIIICCMLASLQSNDPPRVLLTLLRNTELIDAAKQYDSVRNYVIKELKEQVDNNERIIEQINNMFPVNEPMADFIKMTMYRVKKNLRYRIKHPFFELYIIDEIVKKTDFLNKFILKFGATTIIQERTGHDDMMERDIMYDFILPDYSNTASFGLKMTRASFHFISIHYKSSGEIENTSNVVSKCPFYTSCCSSVRKSDSSICAKTPWETRKINNNKDCYYAAALKATNPPQNDQL